MMDSIIMAQLCDGSTKRVYRNHNSRLTHASATILVCLTLSSQRVAIATEGKPMSGQSCNPVDVLEAFAEQTLPDYNIANKSVHIEDKGSTWEVTYYTPKEKMDINNLTVGGGFPIVVIDKANCEVVAARFYQ
jgi:hypothetical protein